MGTPVKLPLVPGLVAQSPPVAGPRAQTLSFKNGYALTESPLSVTGALVAALAAPSDVAQTRVDQAPALSKPPGWLVNDKKVLRFFGYFEEPVPEGFNAPSLIGSAAKEPYRVRRLDVLFYLVDDTVEVSEPRVANSGIVQGTFLKRVRVPRKEGGFLGTGDLRVGGDISLFGRVVHVCGVDAFTREWYAAAGKPQASDLAIPESPLDVVRARKAAEARNKAKKGKSEAVRRGMQFLASDGKVLRFEGRLAEREGDIKLVVVCFYLGDGSIEIKEKGAQLLLHRQQLPVNARGAGVAAVGYDPEESFVSYDDLIVGASVDVFSRTLQLTDCDPFTRSWYAETLGVEQPEALTPPAGPPARPVAVIPPHNGYGEPEDALRNVGVLIPKKGKEDLVQHSRFMQLNGVTLRFTAEMVAADPAKPLHPTDEGRSFVVTLYLEDDSIQIYEPQQRDRPGGRFLERTKVRKSGTDGPFVTAKDFQVGAALLLHGRRFLLKTADQFAVNFMAEHPSMFA